jgi:hypothetical protein
MDRILGASFPELDGEIDVEWAIAHRETSIARGSNRSYGFSPIWHPDHSGLVIGHFEAEFWKLYTLDLTSHNQEPSWDICEPRVRIGEHASRQEWLILPALLGYLIAWFFGPLLACAVGVKLHRVISSKYPVSGRGI